jgi:hypothetical protein
MLRPCGCTRNPIFMSLVNLLMTGSCTGSELEGGGRVGGRGRETSSEDIVDDNSG